MIKVSFRLDAKEGFVSTVDGKQQISIKNSQSDNTRNFSPTELSLFGMAGCTGDDVLSILGKMKEDVKTFSIEIEGHRYHEPPKVLREVHLSYSATGKVSPDKFRKAINLSLSKYCSVSILARRGGAHFTYDFSVNGKNYGKEEPEDPVPTP